MAATTKERPEREPRKRQQHLPTMEPPSIPEIDKAAAKYVDARDARMELTIEESDAKLTLISAMREHKLTDYEFDGMVVTLESLANVKVKKKKSDDPDD